MYEHDGCERFLPILVFPVEEATVQERSPRLKERVVMSMLFHDAGPGEVTH
jgi:hypothetical protein